MSKSKIIALCFSTLLFVFPISASAQNSIQNLSVNDCTLNEVINRLKFQSIQRRADISEQSLIALRTISTLIEKATDDSKPVGSQLSLEDNDKFSRSSQQVQTMKLSLLMESRRIRDLEAIERMVILADQDYRFSQTPNDGTNDAVYRAGYQFVKLSSGKLEMTEPKTNQCTLEFALHKQSLEPLAKLDPLMPKVQEASNYIDFLSSKYKMATIDENKISAIERNKLRDIKNSLVIVKTNYEYVRDIQAIKILAQALELMHQAGLQDIAIGGGAIEAIGKTIQRNIQNNNYDESTKLAMSVWTRINEKIPSQDIQDFQELTQ